MLYFDGNKSTRDTAGHTVLIDFCNHPLASRVGIPLVAGLTSTSIVPTICRRGSTLKNNTITFARPVTSRRGEPESHRMVMQQLWDGLAEDVAADPSQWESLRYAHSFISYPAPSDAASCLGSQELSFNRRRFAFKRAGDRGELFDRARLSIIGVKGMLLEAMTIANEAPDGADVGSLLPSSEVARWMFARSYLTQQT